MSEIPVVGDPNYFACSCGQEGKDECERFLREAKQLLNADDSNLLTKVVHSFHIDYGAEITSIACDQWCGIWTKTQDYDLKEKKFVDPPVFSTAIMCDRVEHGIAATWLAYRKKFGEKRINIE